MICQVLPVKGKRRVRGVHRAYRTSSLWRFTAVLLLLLLLLLLWPLSLIYARIEDSSVGHAGYHYGLECSPRLMLT